MAFYIRGGRNYETGFYIDVYLPATRWQAQDSVLI